MESRSQKIDLSHAYQQLPLDETTKQYVGINTHKGLLLFAIIGYPSTFHQLLVSSKG